MARIFDEAISAFQRGDLGRARDLAERQLAAGDRSPQLHHLLGLLDCRSGKFESGVEWLRRASEAEPTNIAYRVMLVRALMDRGRPEDALDAAERPTGVSPPELALWHARAEAATAIEAWQEAADAWGRLCASGVGDWRAWSNLGDSLGASGRWREATRALEQAVNRKPGDIGLRRNYAGALNNAGRHEQSVEQFRRCIEAAPRDKSLRISLAPILADLGREAESAAELNAAAQLAGEREACDDGAGLVRLVMDDDGRVDVRSLVELAELLDRTSRMDALARLLDDAERLGVAREQVGLAAAASALRQGNPEEAKRLLLRENTAAPPLRWHWLNARSEDALGDPEAAFMAAETMNRSAQDYAQWRQVARRHIEQLRALADVVSTDWSAKLRRLEPLESEDPRQAFIVGFPRSGTTLLDTFLRGHPETEVLEELPLTHELERVLGDVSRLPACSDGQLQQARDAYTAERNRHIAAGFNGMVIDKLPLNMLAAPHLSCVFPDAPIIFAQRHPCDVVLSCFMQSFALTPAMACFLDIGDAAEFYDAAMTFWVRSREVLPLKVHTIVYEELVTDPEESLRPAIEFLGLEWRPELLDHRKTARERGRINTPSYNQVTQPLNRAASGRWRRYRKQLEPVLPLLLPWAERLGYSDD